MNKYRNKILEIMDEGLADPVWLVEALVVWMSEDAAKEFYGTYLVHYGKYETEDEE